MWRKWSESSYWARGALICIPLGIILFIVLAVIDKSPYSIWGTIQIILIGGVASGTIVGGFIGSFFDLLKNKKLAPLAIFIIIILFMILARLTVSLF